MEALFIENMAPIMFGSLVFFLLLGYPAAFSLGAVGLIFALIGIELGLFVPDFLQALPERVYGVMNNDTLLAIPFFTFMGLVLERSGMAEDLLDTIGQLFGTVRGGLAYAVVFVGALLAATTGVVAASVISMGLISLPIMLRYGYDRRVATGIIAASGTLAQIIPPSLVLIVMADQLGKSVGDMYEGAFIPGMVLSGLYAAYVFLVAMLFPKATPGLPPEAIGFKELERGWRDLLSRSYGFILTILAVVAVAALAYYLYTTSLAGILTIKTGTPGIDQAGDYSTAIIVVLCIAGLLWALRPLIKVVKHGGDERGLLSLLGLAIASTVFGWLMMRHSTSHGADFVVLSMFFGILFAFAVTVVNWALFHFTGYRFMSHMAQQTAFVMVPPLFLIFLVLGTIFIGVATPTEGGAMGASGALILGALKRRLTWDLVRQAVESTAKLSAFVVFILIGARVFSLTFYGVSGHIWVENMLTSLPGGQVGFLVFVNLFVFVLAFFLDFFELAFIIIPLLGPAAEHLGIDLIWFGVILGVNMQTSFMHPPFGFALFYLRSVAPREPYNDRVTGQRMEPVTTGQIYWGAVPFVIIQVIMVALVIMFPAMVMHYKGTASTVDPSKVKIEIPQIDLPSLDFGPPK
ncbi:MAG: TRAP transporter large permease subunit [Rhodopseudomonas sp.]|nr:TRAP transporter large permease subunit [Rhodopseudomonas sp.]